MRKRLLYLSAVLSSLFFCSFCDVEKGSEPSVAKKIAITQHETSKSVDINNFFLFN